MIEMSTVSRVTLKREKLNDFEARADLGIVRLYRVKNRMLHRDLAKTEEL
jgi:hypothetical protein